MLYIGPAVAASWGGRGSTVCVLSVEATIAPERLSAVLAVSRLSLYHLDVCYLLLAASLLQLCFI